MWRLTGILRKGNKTWSSNMYTPQMWHTDRIHSLSEKEACPIYGQSEKSCVDFERSFISNFDALFYNKQLCSIDQSQMKVLEYLPLPPGCNHVCMWSVACTERQKVKGQHPLSRHLPRWSVQSRACTSTVACTAKRYKGEPSLNTGLLLAYKVQGQ